MAVTSSAGSALVEPALDDWDDAYANRPYIPGAQAYIDGWPPAGAAFRATREGRMHLGLPYGPHERQRFDLFLPDSEPVGLLVFVHGGYWMFFHRDHWSQLAAGALAHGFAVAMPSYRICPEVRVGDIVQDVAAAVAKASEAVAGPIRLAGHSAGGQIASRMVSRPSPLQDAVLKRIVGVTSISGLHDLGPLRRTSMNEKLRIDAAEVAAESPVRLRPVEGIATHFWVGALERPEFLRQTAMMGEAWGAETTVEPGRHHFDIVDGLADPHHRLVHVALGL
jgi:pimeloyl-ACP methyl ester carboxylesterase